MSQSPYSALESVWSGKTILVHWKDSTNYPAVGKLAVTDAMGVLLRDARVSSHEPETLYIPWSAIAFISATKEA